MPTMHILSGTLVRSSPTDGAHPLDTGPRGTPVTLCGRRDIPWDLISRHLEEAQEKAAESSWVVCPGCIAAYGALACSNP